MYMIVFSHGYLSVRGTKMQIQSINAINSMSRVNPVSKVDFEKRKTPQTEGNNEIKDSFISSSDNINQKYDIACRLAAFYKNQYDNLVKEGSCQA